ncbi:matrix-remodeling-associated protein 7 isoform X2 [Nelusetta ayraudi]|uniref:matrix-remodeling-associated protein 7 isoform X2 n=1 Tax=Nelusetta ayraudi TaxID=303726 RepID=UPI003F704F6E
MDLTFILSAAIFTLLAIVVATSLLNGSSATGGGARPPGGPSVTRNADAPGPGLSPQNGHLPDRRVKEKKKVVVEEEEENWCDISGSSHDHWDVVKSVQTAQCQSARGEEDKEEHASPTPTYPEVDSSSEASSGRSRKSFIGLSDKELLKCAFSHLQAEGATESPELLDDTEIANEDGSLTYLPGKSRSHHMEMMMSKEELEEEQRVQREQLAAIFQLLRDNKETFGDVSEGDMEEQLRLYSI